MSESLVWSRDGALWPLRECSEFVRVDGLQWHVQRLGRGPTVLLIHGTGASTHSWAGLAPLLAAHASVVSVDLPGHAFTDALPARRMTLEGMSAALGALIGQLGASVQYIVGHSAGAAIGLRMVLDGVLHPQAIFSINGALLPFTGVAGLLFPPAARLMALNGLAARLFARHAQDPRAVRRLIASTGSSLDSVSEERYAVLVRDVRHTQGTLDMMAHWDLRSLVSDLPRLRVPVVMLVGAQDQAVPPEQSLRVLGLLRGAVEVERIVLPGLGHLAHEERPTQLADLLLSRMSLPRSGL